MSVSGIGERDCRCRVLAGVTVSVSDIGGRDCVGVGYWQARLCRCRRVPRGATAPDIDQAPPSVLLLLMLQLPVQLL